MDEKIGATINRLTCISYAGRNKHNRSLYNFRCDCGTKVTLVHTAVKQGRVKSCGCLLYEFISQLNKTHGKSETKAYRIWGGVKNRCLNKNNQAYLKYGGRGITICKRWMCFENFYEDMGDPPEDTSIDRIDNNKGYYKENCRWATRAQQGSNQRTNAKVMYKGKEITVISLSRLCGIPSKNLWARIFSGGWTIEKATRVPLRYQKQK